MLPNMRSTLPPDVQEAMKAKKKTLSVLAEQVHCSIPVVREILRGDGKRKDTLIRLTAKKRLESILGIELPA